MYFLISRSNNHASSNAHVIGTVALNKVHNCVNLGCYVLVWNTFLCHPCLSTQMMTSVRLKIFLPKQKLEFDQFCLDRNFPILRRSPHRRPHFIINTSQSTRDWTGLECCTSNIKIYSLCVIDL